MKKDLIIVSIGVLIALVPFLGFPNSWDTVIYVALGLSIVFLMLMLRRELVKNITNENVKNMIRKTDSFVENGMYHEKSDNSGKKEKTRNVAVKKGKESKDEENKGADQ